MRITGIETIALQYRMPYSLTFARGEYDIREALLLKVHTDDPDIVGWGESAMWGGPHAVSATVIEREIAPLVVGEDPRRPELVWEKVYQHTFYHGRKGILLACLSGVDIALWDIVGKCAGMPLWQLLGGFGRPIQAYASSGYYRREHSVDDFAADVSKAREQGFRGYKMKIGNIAAATHADVIDVPLRITIEADLQRVAAAREAVGSDRALMVDANTSLDVATAMRYADRLEPLEVCWFEEPVAPEDIAGCAALAGRTRIDIAGFETETGKYQFAALMDAGAVQMVQPDVVQVGGITEAVKIAHYAQMKHLHFSSKNYSTAVSLAACLQLLYALPNGNWFECDQDPLPWRDEILVAPGHRLDDGLAWPSDRPGLGIEVDEQALAQWRVTP